MAPELIEELAAIKERGHGAFWGAAAGDALGWPHEMPKRVRRSKDETDNRQGVFRPWQRRSGGRFMPHEETIDAGEYSDDTQLMLCTARSILKGSDWLGYFACMELPSWSTYQRGAGGATARAVESWVAGKYPWSSSHDEERRRKYFEAGGNGVAMRIIPHSLWGARHEDFRATSRAIFLNGICTHGHPRALLGALLYGYVAWTALQHFRTLPYGFLLESALSDLDKWSALPRFTGVLTEWKREADNLGIQFESIWTRTKEEISLLLQKSLDGIKAGILVNDYDVLSELGCFNASVKGAGTITAASSIYLASRYAPDPAHGISLAATSEGSDTDTLASMTGALLGITSGLEWLQQFVFGLQDAAYLAKLSEDICNADAYISGSEELKQPPSPPRARIQRFEDSLQTTEAGTELELPDGRQARVDYVRQLSTSSQTLKARLWHLHTLDGQTIYVKKLTRDKRDDRGQLATAKAKTRAKKTRLVSKIQAVKLLVKDLEKSRFFYGDVLGLKIARESKSLINFGKVVSLVPSEYAQESGFHFGATGGLTRAIICLETSSIDTCYEHVKDFLDAKVSAITIKAGRKMFRCIDPDLNLIEIFEKQRNDQVHMP